MRPAEGAVFATSEARELCLSLRRAFFGPRALERLRAGEAAMLRPDELRLALGLAWAAREVELVRTALGRLPPAAIDADPVLAAFRDVTR